MIFFYNNITNKMTWSESTHIQYNKKSKNFKIINKNKRSKEYYYKKNIIDFPKQFYKISEALMLALFIYIILCIIAKFCRI